MSWLSLCHGKKDSGDYYFLLHEGVPKEEVVAVEEEEGESDYEFVCFVVVLIVTSTDAPEPEHY